MTRCKSCDALIQWIKTPAGKSHPIDAKPLKVWGFINNQWRLIDGHLSHFATCPDADKHRKRG